MKVKYLGFILLLFGVFLFIAPGNSFAEKVLVVDPGHGGKFGGTCGFSGNKTGICEEDVNLQVALKLRDVLKNSDIKVYLNRTTDTEFAPYLQNKGGDMDVRMQVANGFAKGNNDNSLFVSIHHNSATSPYASGLETYYYDGKKYYDADYPPDPMQLQYLNDSKRFAEEVHPRLVSKLKRPDRKIHSYMSFYVIRNAQMPSILVELGFMTNKYEESLIKSAAYQQKAAEAIAQGAIQYFKVFEVYNVESGKKLGTFETKDAAIAFANKQSVTTRVFDKDKQVDIYATNHNFEVYHKTLGLLGEFRTEEQAIAYARKYKNTRVTSVEENWTLWSNYVPSDYELYVGDSLKASYFDYSYALSKAFSEKNAKIMKKSSGDVLWSNNSNVKITRTIKTNKVSGKDRVLTAVAISKQLYPNGFPAEKENKTVILATAYDFADALSAGPLANVYEKAPILLTRTDTLDEAVKQEIIRLGAKKVVILGGKAAVSLEAENTLKALNLETMRLEGKTRYDTNKAIIKQLGNVNGVFVASGTSFADALSVAPIAAKEGWAIALTKKEDLTVQLNQTLQGKKVILVGGTAVLSTGLERQVKSSGVVSLSRLSGETRYDTLASVLWYFKDSLASNTINLATGINYPDALTASPLSIGTNAPLILVKDEIPKSIESFLLEYKTSNKIDQVNVIGGVVESPVIESLANTVR
ncbi:cell wall-binding repeat-containing protein [Bacillus timonensis]|uniref:cell wall-binding repeat-containing protein n=1 Tax=Bacillus timonensis TaxID=1033734 RepID=UPI000289F82D|nr:cell wall-binding repeat-containing protein [Bacillus timonensis]